MNTWWRMINTSISLAEWIYYCFFEQKPLLFVVSPFLHQAPTIPRCYGCITRCILWNLIALWDCGQFSTHRAQQFNNNLVNPVLPSSPHILLSHHFKLLHVLPLLIHIAHWSSYMFHPVSCRYHLHKSTISHLVLLSGKTFFFYFWFTLSLSSLHFSSWCSRSRYTPTYPSYFENGGGVHKGQHCVTTWCYSK